MNLVCHRIISYRMCLAKLPEYSKAQQLFTKRKYDEASGYFERSLDVFSRMPPNNDLYKLYTHAINNEIKSRHYLKAYEYINQQLHMFPERVDDLYVTAHILAAISNTKRPTEASVNKDYEPIILAIQNIVTGHEAPFIKESDLPLLTFETKCREATIVSLSNYLTICKTYPQKTKVLMQPALTPIAKYLSNSHEAHLQIDNMLTDQQKLIPKLTNEQHHRMLYALCYLLFNSGTFDNKVISLWLNIFLKLCQGNFKQYLYRPLYMLAVFYRNNNKAMIAEGLFNSALDIIDRQLSPDEHRLIMMSKADLIVENEKHIEEAEQLRQQYAPEYNFRRVLLQMII